MATLATRGPSRARESGQVALFLAAVFLIAHAQALPPGRVLAASDIALSAQPFAAERPTHERAKVGSSRVDLQACKLEYSIVSPK